MRAAATAAAKGQTEQALDRLLAPTYGEDWRDRFSRPRLGAIRRHAAALGSLLGTLADYEPTSAELAAINAPTLILRGTSGPPLVGLMAERLASLVPSARLETIENGNGPLDLADPETGRALATAVLDALSN